MNTSLTANLQADCAAKDLSIVFSKLNDGTLQNVKEALALTSPGADPKVEEREESAVSHLCEKDQVAEATVGGNPECSSGNGSVSKGGTSHPTTLPTCIAIGSVRGALLTTTSVRMFSNNPVSADISPQASQNLQGCRSDLQSSSLVGNDSDALSLITSGMAEQTFPINRSGIVGLNLNKKATAASSNRDSLSFLKSENLEVPKSTSCAVSTTATFKSHTSLSTSTPATTQADSSVQTLGTVPSSFPSTDCFVLKEETDENGVRPSSPASVSRPKSENEDESDDDSLVKKAKSSSAVAGLLTSSRSSGILSDELFSVLKNIKLPNLGSSHSRNGDSLSPHLENKSSLHFSSIGPSCSNGFNDQHSSGSSEACNNLMDEKSSSMRSQNNKFCAPLGAVNYKLQDDLDSSGFVDLEPEEQNDPYFGFYNNGFHSTVGYDPSGKRGPRGGPPPGVPSLFYERVRSDIAIDSAPTTMKAMVAATRQLMRKKMHRCKVCKNRFVEKDLFERHIKENHPSYYERYMDEKAKAEEQDRIIYLKAMKQIAEIEERKNQRLAFKYERTHEINQERERLGLPALEMEEIFPPRPKRPRIPTSPPRDANGLEDGEIPANAPPGAFSVPPVVDSAPGRNRRIQFKKRICPQCPFCDKRYRTDTGMRKHIARKHPDCIHYVQCNKCYKMLKNMDELTDHDCDLTFICIECQPIRNMVTADRLYNHRNKFHRGEKSGFRCTECDKKFLTPRKLRKHKKLAHVHTRTYKCHFCEEHFTDEMQVSLHERTHTGKIRYDCNICDYRCNRYVQLIDHKRDDHGYLCMVCGVKVNEWNELKEHTLNEHNGYLCVDSQAVFLVSPRLWILYKGE